MSVESSNPSYIQIDNYQIDKNKILGTGGFATVYLGYFARGKWSVQKEKNKLFAIKEISINSQFEITSSLVREINMLRHLKNRHIIQFIDAKKTEHHFYLIMEYCSEGSMEEYIQTNTPTERLILLFFYQIVNALQYLHSKKIFHRDIKPKNILLHQGEVKLVDFGLSKILADSNINATMGQNTCVGTPQYMAPEMLRGKGWEEKSDIWSLGLTLYFMIFKELPWDGNSSSSLLILEQIEKKFTEPQEAWREKIIQGNLMKNQEKDESKDKILDDAMNNNSNSETINDGKQFGSSQSGKKMNYVQNNMSSSEALGINVSFKGGIDSEPKLSGGETDLTITSIGEELIEEVLDVHDENVKMKSLEDLKYLLPQGKTLQNYQKISVNTLRLIDSMLQIDLKHRLGWNQLFESPLIVQFDKSSIKENTKTRISKKSSQQINEVTPESLIVTQDESGGNQEELRKHGALWDHHLEEMKKQKSMAQQAKIHIEFEMQKAKFLDKTSIMLKEQYICDISLIPKDLYVKCQFLLYKRANIILSDLSKMMAFRLNSSGNIQIDEQLWKAFTNNWDQVLCENIIKENTHYEKKFSIYQIELNQVYKKSENFEMILRGDAFTQSLDENENLIQAYNDNFLQLFQILAEKAFILRKEDRLLGKTNAEIISELRLNIMFIYFLMIILSFRNVFAFPERNMQLFYENCEKVGCIELLTRIEQAYKLWHPMQYE